MIFGSQYNSNILSSKYFCSSELNKDGFLFIPLFILILLLDSDDIKVVDVDDDDDRVFGLEGVFSAEDDSENDKLLIDEEVLVLFVLLLII